MENALDVHPSKEYQTAWIDEEEKAIQQSHVWLLAS